MASSLLLWFFSLMSTLILLHNIVVSNHERPVLLSLIYSSSFSSLSLRIVRKAVTKTAAAMTESTIIVTVNEWLPIFFKLLPLCLPDHICSAYINIFFSSLISFLFPRPLPSPLIYPYIFTSPREGVGAALPISGSAAVDTAFHSHPQRFPLL